MMYETDLAVSVFIGFFRTLLRREHWWAEFYSALVVMLWAIQNWMLPQDLSAVSSFKFIVSVGPDRFWEGAAISVGLIQLSALMCDWRMARLCAAFFTCWFYCFLQFGIMQANHESQLLPFIAGYVGINLFAIIRATWNLR